MRRQGDEFLVLLTFPPTVARLVAGGKNVHHVPSFLLVVTVISGFRRRYTKSSLNVTFHLILYPRKKTKAPKAQLTFSASHRHTMVENGGLSSGRLAPEPS